MDGKLQVKLKFLSSNFGGEEKRIVEVFLFTEGFESFEAYDCQKHRNKTFWLDRLIEADVLKTELAFDGFREALVMDSFGSRGDDSIDVVHEPDAIQGNTWWSSSRGHLAGSLRSLHQPGNGMERTLSLRASENSA